MILLYEPIVYKINKDNSKSGYINLVRLCLVSKQHNLTYSQIIKNICNKLINIRSIITFIDVNKLGCIYNNYINYIKNTGLVYSERWYKKYNTNLHFYIPLVNIDYLPTSWDIFNVSIYRINPDDIVDINNFIKIYKKWKIVNKFTFSTAGTE